MKLYRIAIPALSLPMLLGACHSKSASWENDTAQSALSQISMSVDEAIESMNTCEWTSPDIYNKVRDQYIAGSSGLSESQKSSKSAALAHTYAEQLVRTQKNILAGTCQPGHATLGAAHAEYEARQKEFRGYTPADKASADAQYATHQQQMQFAVSGAYNVPLKSFLDPYDSSYDNRKRAEAAAIRATNPTCTAIKSKVDAQAVDAVLAKRKENYYAALVNKFKNTSDATKEQYSRLRSRLPSGLQGRVDAIWRSKESNALPEFNY